MYIKALNIPLCQGLVECWAEGLFDTFVWDGE